MGASCARREGQGWFESSDEEQFFFCRFTQITVLRLLTTEKIMGKDVRNMSESWELWDKIWADPRMALLPEPEGLEREFRAHSRFKSRSPKVWADAYLLAFAAVAGLRLVTFRTPHCSHEALTFSFSRGPRVLRCPGLLRFSRL